MPFFSGTQRTDNKVYRFTQTLNLGTQYTTAVGAVSNTGILFTMTNSVTQATTFAALFDQYKIDSLEVWLTPNNTNVGANTGAGLFYSSVDYDGIAVASVAAISQRTNVVVSNHNNGHYHRWVPHVAVAAYSGAFTSFLNSKASWIDWSSPTVQHYGLIATSEATPIGAFTIDAVARVNFSCRNIT